MKQEIGKNLWPPEHDFYSVPKVLASILGVFLVILGHWWGPLGLWMHSMASLNVGDCG